MHECRSKVSFYKLSSCAIAVKQNCLVNFVGSRHVARHNIRHSRCVRCNCGLMEQQMRIIKCMDEVYSGIGGQSVAID